MPASAGGLARALAAAMAQETGPNGIGFRTRKRHIRCMNGKRFEPYRTVWRSRAVSALRYGIRHPLLCTRMEAGKCELWLCSEQECAARLMEQP